MAIDVDKLISIERKYIGYKESPAGSNRTIFGKYTGTDGMPWCASMQCFCLNQAGYSKYVYGGKKFASCTALMKYHKARGQIVTSGYCKGDLLLYQFNRDPLPDHIGLCTGSTSTTVTAIEGNTGHGNDANGGEVMERTRSKSLVLCAVRWWNIGATPGVSSSGVELPPKRPTASESPQMALQRFLVTTYRAPISVDGIVGSETKRALISGIQTELKKTHPNLSVDGIWGQNTEAAFPTVGLRARGNITKAIQLMLKVKGYSLDADGIFGQQSLKAVKEFQKDNKLNVKGIVDRATIKLLIK